MIRWIIDGRLGTAPRGDVEEGDVRILDVRDLVDKSGNAPEVLRRKIDEGVRVLEQGHRLVVTCDFGVSRSNTIAAGILAKWRGIPLDEGLAEVIARTGETSIKIGIVEDLRRTLSDQDGRSRPDTVLITGGSGFLGRNLCVSLSRTRNVLAPSRAEQDLTGSSLLLDKYCRDHGVETIVHLAHPRVYTNNAALGASLTMLRNVIDVCRARGIRLIFPSGSVVFSGYSADLVAAPETPPHPKGIYGETKYLQEEMINLAVLNREVEAVIVRIAPTYGPGGDRPRLIRYFYAGLMADDALVTHRYRNNAIPRLELLFVDDAVAGLESIIGKGSAAVYHLGTGSAVTPAEIARKIGIIVGRTPRFSETLIDEDLVNVMLDFSMTQRTLGWSPRVTIDEGLRRTLMT